MCLLAMNSAFAIMSESEKREVDYKEAVSELLNIDSPFIADDVQKYIEWLKKYGNNKDFLQAYPSETECPSKYPLGEYMAKQAEHLDHSEYLEENLAKTAISFIDKEYKPSISNILYIDLIELASCKIELQAIANLYAFTNGGKLSIQPIEANWHPILPDIVTDWLGDFIDWREVAQIKYGGFLLPDDSWHRSNYSDPTFKFFDAEAQKVATTFKAAGKTGNAEITKEEDFGQEYCRLAEEIIFVYLDKCSSYANFLNYQKFRKYKYVHDEATGRYREISSKDFQRSETEPTGYYRMHNALSTAILDGHLNCCENCKKPFISKRTGAKNCSNKCRVQMSLRKKYVREFLDEQSQPHAEV